MEHYFAYGSNMDPEQMECRCGRVNSRFLGRAMLPGYRLAFTRYSSTRGGGVADAIPDEGHGVWGVVYEVTDDCLAKLDGCEGFYGKGDPRNSYDRDRVTVLIEGDESRPLEAWIYFARRLGDRFLPAREYMEHIIRGAILHELPHDYIEGLKAQETKP